MNFFFLYSEKYDDARAQLDRMRNIVPAIYNINRLREAPIPEAPQNVVDQIEPDQDISFEQSLDQSAESEHDVVAQYDIEHVWIGDIDNSATNTASAVNVNPLHDTTDPANTSSESATTETVNNTDPMCEEVADCKPFVPLHKTDRANNNDIDALLDEYVIEEVDDDMIITVGSKGYGQPFQATPEGLIKFEGNAADDISGGIPFMLTVRTHLNLHLHFVFSNICIFLYNLFCILNLMILETWSYL